MKPVDIVDINNGGEWKKIVAHALSIARHAIFPSQCKVASCTNFLVTYNETARGICARCRDDIRMNRDHQCGACGRLLDTEDPLCGECIITPPGFLRHFSYACYEGIYKDLLLIYKYGEVDIFKHLFAECLVELYRSRIRGTFTVDAVIPVPRDKGRTRDFDHMLEVTRRFSRRIGIKLLRNRLIKIKKTRPQAGLSRALRLKNLDGAFAVRKPRDIEGRTVLLVDDVYTTGTTIRQCTRVLKRLNANVVAVTLARP